MVRTSLKRAKCRQPQRQRPGKKQIGDEVTAHSGSARHNGRLIAGGIPITNVKRSAPARALRRIGISWGRYCRSSSRVTTTSCSAARIPASVAFDWPRLSGCSTMTTLGTCLCRSRRISTEPSVLPSSTKTISTLQSDELANLATFSEKRCRDDSELNTGTIRLIAVTFARREMSIARYPLSPKNTPIET
jgi:hypothetical protein